MKINMSLILICEIILILSPIYGNDVNAENDYFDPVINFLLNGGNFTYSDENDTDVSTVSGIWKCGNCTDIENSTLVYSEENFGDDDNKNSDNIQIELIIDDMRCVTVSADKPGVVQRLTGTCDGAVTLHVTPARRFIVHVYA